MDKRHYDMMNWEEVEAIIYADCFNPANILGIHKKGKSNLIQTFFPDADEVSVIFTCDKEEKTLKLEKVDDSGFFAEFFSFDYSSYYYNVKKNGKIYKNIYDPYAYDCCVDSEEFKNFLKGKSTCAFEIFGCHKKVFNNVEGFEFCVYAPYATCISLVGTFNEWRENANLMQKDKKHEGVFYLFVPGIKENSEYKYLIKSKGFKEYKNDPFALGISNNNSITVDIEYDISFKRKPIKEELQILEVDLAVMFKRYKDKNEVLKAIEESIVHFSYNAVSFISLLCKEADSNNFMNLFSLDLSDANVKDYIYVISELKKKHIYILIEHSISYFSAYAGGLSKFDSSFLYENGDYRLNYHKFYNGLLLDYGKNITKSYVLSSVNYLLKNYPVDGIVYPNVGVMLYHDYNKNPGEYITEEWNSTINSVNVSFIKYLNSYIHTEYQGVVTAAKIYAFYEDVTGKNKDSLGFDYCFNTGACEEILDFFTLDLSRRKEHLDSFLLFTHFDNKAEKYIYPFSNIEKDKYSGLLKDSFSDDGINQLSNLKIAYIYKHLLKGSQLSNIDIDNLFGKNDEDVKHFKTFLSDLRKEYINKKSLMKNFNSEKIFSYKCLDNQIFTREYFDGEEDCLIVFNFSGTSFDEYKIEVSRKGVYSECFNSDKKAYGGRGIKNKKSVETDDIDDNVLTLKIPALSIMAFTYRPFTEEELEDKYQKKKAQMISYVDNEKKKILSKLNEDIKELEKKAKCEINELEKLLKPYDR